MRVSGVAVALAVGMACGRASVFECDEDSDCDLGDAKGVCEDTGYCSFADPACASGQRYGSLAGGGLAGTCVPVDTAGTTGGDGGSGSTGGGFTGSGVTTMPAATSNPTTTTTTSTTTSTTAITSTSGSSSGGGVCVGFEDDFGDGVIGAQWGGASVLISEGMGQLAISVTEDEGDGFERIDTSASYDLSEGTATIRLGTVAAQPGLQQSLRVFPAGAPDNELLFTIDGDQLQAAYSPTIGPIVLYHGDDFEPDEHSWLRIRGAGDIVQFEFAVDGSFWQTFSSGLSPFALSNVTVSLSAGNSLELTNVTVVSFEDAAVCE